MTSSLPSTLVFPRSSPQRTTVAELGANLLMAHTGLMSLLLSVQEAAPQERDYTPQGAGAYAIATREHGIVCRALEALEGELGATIDVVAGTRAATAVPASEFPRLASLVADQPRCFPSVNAGGTPPAILRDSLLGVYRCSLTVMKEFQPATPVAVDYETNREFSLARTRHQAWVYFVSRIGHWFFLMARAVPAR